MDWCCPSCAESVPATFDMCWNCGRPEHNSGPSTTASNRASTEGANYKHPANIRALRRCFRCLLIFFSCAAVIDLLYHGITRFSILVGIQVPESENREFDRFLATLGYPYWEETQNPVYRLFLA